jgi:hypothetical protein
VVKTNMGEGISILVQPETTTVHTTTTPNLDATMEDLGVEETKATIMEE